MKTRGFKGPLAGLFMGLLALSAQGQTLALAAPSEPWRLERERTFQDPARERRDPGLPAADSSNAPQAAATLAMQDSMLKAFYAFMPGRWGTDCAKLSTASRLEGGRLMGQTYFNGVLGAVFAIRPESVRYAGSHQGLYRFEFVSDTMVVASNERVSNRIVMETDLQTVRRSVHSESLAGAILIRDGILQSNNTVMPMQKRCG